MSNREETKMSNSLEDSVSLELIRSESRSKKLVVCLQYPQAVIHPPSTKDIIGLFEVGSTNPIAAANVSHHKGHWKEGSNKAGQVSIDTTNLEFTDNQTYQLAYVRNSTKDIISSSILYLSCHNGVLAKQDISDEDSGFTHVTQAAAHSVHLGSFEETKSTEEPSLSFVVVSEESEPLPQVVEPPPDPIEPEEQWIESVETAEDTPQNIECFEAEDQTVVSKPAVVEPIKTGVDLAKFEAPRNQMSVSVNMSDRIISQREVQTYKSMIKDLTQKLKKMNEILQSREADGASKEEILELRRNIESLKKELKTTKNNLKQVTDERDALLLEKAELVKSQASDQANIRALQRKLAQVTSEKDTLFARSSTLLTALQDKEKENEVLKSENRVLQRKIKLYETEKRQKKQEATRKSPEPRPKDLPLAGAVRPQPKQEKPAEIRVSPHIAAEAPRLTPRPGGELLGRPRPGNERRGNESGVTTNCPICDEVLPAILSERNKQLHVERCILLSEQPKLN